MATAPTLLAAAGQAFDNLYIRWQTNQLRVRVIAFCTAAALTFPDDNARSRPVGNWLIVIRGYVEPLPAVSIELDDLNALAQQIYRICYLASQLNTSGDVTNAQATALLANYNANF